MNDPKATQPENFRDLYNKAIELLARREHSQAELREKLKRKFECTDVDIAQVLARLVELGYQCDQRFAVAFTRERLYRGLGERRIIQELKFKGINASIGEAILAEQAQGDFAAEILIERTWRKKFKAIPQDQKERAKQYRFLQYRGFGGDDISCLFERLKCMPDDEW